MPVLAYCLMDADSTAEEPPAGVGGRPMEELREAGLRCFFSRLESGDSLSRNPALESALSFHQVLQVLFRSAAVVSFRFPTVLSGEEELRQHLRERAPQYREALSRLRDMVQMEVQLSATRPPGTGRPGSGRDYLEERRVRMAAPAAAAERIRQAALPWVVEWRQHQAGGGIRCYALVRRDALPGFQQTIGELAASLPEARLSGPWPATGFLDLKDS